MIVKGARVVWLMSCYQLINNSFPEPIIWATPVHVLSCSNIWSQWANIVPVFIDRQYHLSTYFFFPAQTDGIMKSIVANGSRSKGSNTHHDVIKWETSSASLALCEGNPPVTDGLPSQRPVTQSFGVFFDLRLNKSLAKQSRHRWFETSSRSLWRHCNATGIFLSIASFLLLFFPDPTIATVSLKYMCGDGPYTGRRMPYGAS